MSTPVLIVINALLATALFILTFGVSAVTGLLSRKRNGPNLETPGRVGLIWAIANILIATDPLGLLSPIDQPVALPSTVLLVLAMLVWVVL